MQTIYLGNYANENWIFFFLSNLQDFLENILLVLNKHMQYLE